MDTAPVISTLPPELKSQDFAFLRSEGLSVIQQLAAGSWTDHNLHDPGITLLEALCYAITEAGLRTGIDIKDLLASSGVFRSPEFFTAARVLPTAPITLVDFRKSLTDHPLINNAWFFPLKSEPLGRYSALLEFADDSLNSNNFAEQVSAGGPPAQTYAVDIAFPHWDDENLLLFREPVTLQTVIFNEGVSGDEWNEIEGNTSFFTRATITFQLPAGGSQVRTIWVVVQITTEMEDPPTEAPLVLQQVLTLLNDLTADKPFDKLNKRVTAAHQTMRDIRRYILPHRNLCEDIGEFNAVRQQEVGVNATIEVGSGVNIEDLVAEVFYSIDHLVSPLLHFQTLDEQLAESGSADAVFNGPLAEGGFLDNQILFSQQITSVLYTSDILRLIYQLRNASSPTDIIEREDVSARRIISVRTLSLSNFLDNRAISTGARDCLQLVKSQRHIPRLSLSKSRIIIFRNGVRVEYDFNRVRQIYDAKKAGDVQASTFTALDLAVPAGQVYPVGEYYPVQNDLPLTYGVGEAGLPDHTTIPRRAQARQLKGYLFLFEQLIAGFQAQLAQFNAFFSADTTITQTLFQQPLYHLPDIAPLFAALSGQSAADWQNFQNNAANPYAQLLRNGAETREQFLERRNAVLDHLLAMLGEDMTDRVALVLRLAVDVPGGSAMPLPILLTAQRQARLNALEDLIRDKSVYYTDVPELNMNKAQAFGNLLWPATQFIVITPEAGKFLWQVNNAAGNPLFRQFIPAASAATARRLAGQTIKLATATGHYTVRTQDGETKLALRSNAELNPTPEDPLNTIIAVSVAPYATVPDAQAAIATAANDVLSMWIRYALIPLELRLYHLLGIDLRERRRLVNNKADYIDVFPDPVVNPDNRHLFRLRSVAGVPGNILLESSGSYPGATAADAIEAATAATEQMIDYGSGVRNYHVERTGVNSFTLTLRTAADTLLAQSPITFTSNELAQAEADRIRTHLIRLFTVEGFYLVEHHLLYPPDGTGPPLEILGQKDPYSLQLTVIFPSGYERDFPPENPEQPPPPPPPSTPARPHLYRNEEFRKYAEQQVRKHCPAHILVRILWVDRSLVTPPGDAMDPSLDAFEVIYFAWLQAYMTDEADAAMIDTPRNNLREMLNGLYEEYFTI